MHNSDISYSSDLNCTLLVALQNQTCDGLGKKLFVQWQRKHKPQWLCTFSVATLQVRLSSAWRTAVVSFLATLGTAEKCGCLCSGLAWPPESVQGPVKGALEDRVAPWRCAAASPHGSVGEQRTKLTSLQRCLSTASSARLVFDPSGVQLSDRGPGERRPASQHCGPGLPRAERRLQPPPPRARGPPCTPA